MRYMFLEKKPELLLAAPTDAVTVNINSAIVYDALSIDNWV